jgi:5-methyltetrahydrofolate--homocysteine methyltransferase
MADHVNESAFGKGVQAGNGNETLSTALRERFAKQDLSGLTIKDDRLRAALQGECYLVVDGAMGTQLQERGLDAAEELPELLNLTHPEDITAIHAAYVAAGADVITTNTFGANPLKLDGRAGVAEVFAAAAKCARVAGAAYVAGDIGPSGALLEPLGTMTFDEAYDLFAEQVDAAVAAGCDILLIETMADLREAKAALLAARERCSLPVFVTMTFGEDGRTFLGTPPEVAAEVLSSMGAQAVGLNCSLGPNELLGAARAMAARVRCPLMVQPNAGLPRMEGGQTVFDVSAQEFAQAMETMMDAGASVIGGCCGTSPKYTRLLRKVADERGVPAPRPYEPATVLASAQRAVVLPFGKPQVAVIGERINPTGKPKLKAALRAGDIDYIVGEAVMQQENGADVLDVNVGLPELDEPAVLTAAVDKLSATVPLPLVIDSSDAEAVEAAVRGYAGKPLINSVNGKQESMDAVLPIVKKYGCAVIGLALDEGGIPPTAEGRFAIAERIVAEAERYGIPRTDVVIDCLTMACATNQAEAREILRAITLVKDRLGCRTALGVSNISFGLPQRNMVNATFLAAAFGCGLDLPILNPKARRYTDTVNTFRVLNCQDEGARGFIETYAEATDPYEAPVGGAVSGAGVAGGAAAVVSGSSGVSSASTADACPIEIPEQFADAVDDVREMVHLIMTGRRGPMGAATEALLVSHDPLDLVNGVFIPALDVVGDKFDKGAFFLPQLMASAEAVKAGFDVVRTRVGSSGQDSSTDRAIAVATVKGDIHDIGKNIVKMLLENYGYRVVDLGRDVDPEEILSVCRERGIMLVGLSALMTTTVRSMEQTIELLHEQLPGCKVMVGGAVLTQDYAEQIHADYYAKDAAESARIAERFFSE